MKNFFLSLDLEEWYHLEYLTKYNYEKKTFYIPRLNGFFEILKKYDIKITVFVLAELAVEFPSLIAQIHSEGHEIALHGFDHQLLYSKTNEQFKQELKNAISILEGITHTKVYGFRAPCFSMDIDKLELLKNVGILYNSSYIKFSSHPYYRQFALDGFSIHSDHIYRNSSFFEFEMPTYKIGNNYLPISGGGYFRLFPYSIFKKIFFKFMKFNTNFTFYIHPFELNPDKIKLKGISLKDKLRFTIGRKSNLKNLEKFLITLKKENYTFWRFYDYIKYEQTINNRS